MRMRNVNAFPIIALMMACGSAAHSRLPADSYTVVHSQLKSGDALVPVQGATVTLEFFERAGVRPLLGRFFIDGDQRSPAGVVVISHDMWRERFASSPTVVGRTLELDGRTATIVGIAPRDFKFPAGTEFWTPRSVMPHSAAPRD